MPFDRLNDAQSFQRHIDYVLLLILILLDTTSMKFSYSHIHTLNSEQKNYSAFDHDLLVSTFVIFSKDIHSSYSLVASFLSILPLSIIRPTRKLRQTTFLSEFNFSKAHVSGKKCRCRFLLPFSHFHNL